MSSWINFNGKILPSRTSKFNFEHFAIARSFILQETIRLHNGVFLFSERHYFHIMAQMRMARMKIPLSYTPENFYNALDLLNEKLRLDNATFTFRVTQNGRLPQFWITATKLEGDELISSNPYTIDLYKESHVDNSFLNRINFARPQHGILKIYAEENHIDDLILLNNQKSIARSIYGNIFMLKDNHLITPTLENGAFDDVLRDRILTVCKRMPHFDSVKEEEIFPFKLTKADELFISKNGQGIIPIDQFRKTLYNKESTTEIPEFLLELA